MSRAKLYAEKMVPVALRLPASLKESLVAVATERGVSVNEGIIAAVKVWIGDAPIPPSFGDLCKGGEIMSRDDTECGLTLNLTTGVMKTYTGVVINHEPDYTADIWPENWHKVYARGHTSGNWSVVSAVGNKPPGFSTWPEASQIKWLEENHPL